MGTKSRKKSQKRAQKKLKKIRARQLATGEKKPNPFEMKFIKRKQKVFGRSNDVSCGKPIESKVKANEKRKNLLLADYRKFKRSGQMILEEDRPSTKLTDAQLISHRKRLTAVEKKHRFNLTNDVDSDDDNELVQLTHLGQNVAQIERFDGDGQRGGDDDVGDNDDDGGVIENVDTLFDEGSWKERTERMIGESKAAKLARQREHDEVVELTEKIDTDWKEFLRFGGVIEQLGPVYDKKAAENRSRRPTTDYDRSVNELQFAPRARNFVTPTLATGHTPNSDGKTDSSKSDKRNATSAVEKTLPSDAIHVSADALDVSEFVNAERERRSKLRSMPTIDLSQLLYDVEDVEDFDKDDASDDDDDDDDDDSDDNGGGSGGDDGNDDDVDNDINDDDGGAGRSNDNDNEKAVEETAVTESPVESSKEDLSSRLMETMAGKESADQLIDVFIDFTRRAIQLKESSVLKTIFTIIQEKIESFPSLFQLFYSESFIDCLKQLIKLENGPLTDVVFGSRLSGKQVDEMGAFRLLSSLRMLVLVGGAGQDSKVWRQLVAGSKRRLFWLTSSVLSGIDLQKVIFGLNICEQLLAVVANFEGCPFIGEPVRFIELLVNGWKLDWWTGLAQAEVPQKTTRLFDIYLELWQKARNEEWSWQADSEMKNRIIIALVNLLDSYINTYAGQFRQKSNGELLKAFEPFIIGLFKLDCAERVRLKLKRLCTKARSTGASVSHVNVCKQRKSTTKSGKKTTSSETPETVETVESIGTRPRPKCIEILEPKFDDGLTGKRQRKTPSNVETAKALKKQLKKETKDAIREVRRDNEFLARQRLVEQVTADNERRQRTKRLMHELSGQQAEANAIKRRKF